MWDSRYYYVISQRPVDREDYQEITGVALPKEKGEAAMTLRRQMVAAERDEERESLQTSLMRLVDLDKAEKVTVVIPGTTADTGNMVRCPPYLSIP